ncbi:MAG: PAS domain S-box protein, partial [Archangium sp.]
MNATSHSGSPRTDGQRAWAPRLFWMVLPTLALPGDEPALAIPLAWSFAALLAALLLGLVLTARELRGERRRAAELQQRLEVQQGRDGVLRSVLENAPDFISIIKPDGTFEFLNRIAPGLHIESVVGHSILEYLLPEYRAIARSCAERVARTGEPGYFESQGLGPEGHTACYETRVAPIRQDGRIVSLVLIATDITRRKQMELELRESRDRLQLAVAGSRMGLWSWEPQPDRVIWDETTAALFGFPLEQAPKTYTDYIQLMLPEERERLQVHVEDLLHGGAFWEDEFQVRLPNGAMRWLLSRAIALRDEQGRLVKLIGGLIDTTARKRIEEALREREHYFRSLLENALDLIAIVSARGEVRYVSPSSQRLLALAPEELHGKQLHEWLHPEDLPAFRNLIGSLTAWPGTTGSATMRLRHRNGTWRTFEGIWKNLEDDPTVGGLLINARDVTERQVAEEALHFLTGASAQLASSLDPPTLLS